MRKLFLSAIVCALSLSAADFSGTWIGQVAGRNGDLLDVALKLTQSGTTVTGKLYGDYQSDPISDVRISGDLITFIVTGAQQNGNEINQTRLRFSGKLLNGALELTRERGRL